MVVRAHADDCVGGVLTRDGDQSAALFATLRRVVVSTNERHVAGRVAGHVAGQACKCYTSTPLLVPFVRCPAPQALRGRQAAMHPMGAAPLLPVHLCPGLSPGANYIHDCVDCGRDDRPYARRGEQRTIGPQCKRILNWVLPAWVKAPADATCTRACTLQGARLASPHRSWTTCPVRTQCPPFQKYDPMQRTHQW